MTRTTHRGITKGFCTICMRSNCNGYGDGFSIPDHTPDMDSMEEGGSVCVTCNICGKPVTHDFKGNPEEGPSWRQVVDAWYAEPDYIDSNHQNDDDVDFCETCWAVIMTLFRSCHSCANFPYRDVCSAAQCGGSSNGFPGFVLSDKSCVKCANFPHLMQCHKPNQCGGAVKGFPRFEPKTEKHVPAWGSMPDKTEVKPQ